MGVHVVEYSTEWALSFASVAAGLAEALEDVTVLSIEHVGSTAVPGLAAKPILDIDVIVARDAVYGATAALQATRYQNRGDLGITDRASFRAPDKDPLRHVYICVAGSLHVRNHLAVRDILQSNRSLGDRYAAVKWALSTDPTMDIDRYIAGKSEVLQEVLALSELTNDERRLIYDLNTYQAD